MGGWSKSIGKYSVQQMDYDYDEIDKIHSKEGLEKFLLEVYLFYPKEGVKNHYEEIKIPLTELHNIIPDEDRGSGYTISWDDDEKSLRNWLWKEINKREWVVEGSFKLILYSPNADYSKLPNYYLNSPILSDESDIKLSTKPTNFIITKLEELDWLAEKGFIFS